MMKLLIEFTPHGGVMQRISNEDIPLTYQWFGYVFSFSSFRLDLEKDYGGYAKPSFSDVTISPDAFSGNWPPTGAALFKIMLTTGGEAEAVTIFSGYGIPTKFDRHGVSYKLATPEFNATIAEGVVQTGSLFTRMAAYCAALGLTLDQSNASSEHPCNVNYTPTAEVKIIHLMSDMSAFFTHGFTIIDGTLYLHDMKTTGDKEVITEFDAQLCTYGKADPVSLLKCGDVVVDGGVSYGKDISVQTAYHQDPGNIAANLENIKTVLQKDTIEIDTMLDQTTVAVLDDITIIDNSTIEPTITTAKAVSTLYNFDDYTRQIEAIGVVG